jgi:hypothetical protein
MLMLLSMQNCPKLAQVSEDYPKTAFFSMTVSQEAWQTSKVGHTTR